MKDDFIVPYMVLHRCDLEFMDTEENKISEKVTDEQMENIALEIGKQLAQDWNELISDIRVWHPELFKGVE